MLTQGDSGSGLILQAMVSLMSVSDLAHSILAQGLIMPSACALAADWLGSSKQETL